MQQASIKGSGDSSDAGDSTDLSNNSDENVQGEVKFKEIFRNNKGGHAESSCLQQLKEKGSEAKKDRCGTDPKLRALSWVCKRNN